MSRSWISCINVTSMDTLYSLGEYCSLMAKFLVYNKKDFLRSDIFNLTSGVKNFFKLLC